MKENFFLLIDFLDNYSLGYVNDKQQHAFRLLFSMLCQILEQKSCLVPLNKL